MQLYEVFNSYLKKSLPYLLITKIKFFVFQEEELRVVTERLEVIKRDKLNNQQTTRELEMEKRSQRIDINKNNASRAEVEQSQEDRKKILELEEKNLTEEDDKNAADIGEEGNLIWQIPFIFLADFWQYQG
jgi:hypothetical protein